MSTISGSKGKIFVGSNQVAEVKSWSMEITTDTVDASIIGTEWRKNQATIKGWSGDIEAFWDKTDIDGQGALEDNSSVTLNLYPEGDDTGSTYWSGDAIVSSISYDGTFDSIVGASFKFTGTGPVNKQLVA